MIDSLRTIVARNSVALGQEVLDASKLSFTKFCQRVAAPHTKVLFLVTHKGRLLCILKVMRNASFNAKLRNERQAQETASTGDTIRAPQVYFESEIDGHYVYAEEVVQGTPISHARAKQEERSLVEYLGCFPHEGALSSRSIAEVLAQGTPEEHAGYAEALGILSSLDCMLSTGFSHGDLGRPNIIVGNMSRLYIIDFERSGDIPFRFIDAVYFLSRVRNARLLSKWRADARGAFMSYTRYTLEQADALFAISRAFEILYRHYPDRYQRAVTALRALL